MTSNNTSLPPSPILVGENYDGQQNEMRSFSELKLNGKWWEMEVIKSIYQTISDSNKAL